MSSVRLHPESPFIIAKNSTEGAKFSRREQKTKWYVYTEYWRPVPELVVKPATPIPIQKLLFRNKCDATPPYFEIGYSYDLDIVEKSDVSHACSLVINGTWLFRFTTVLDSEGVPRNFRTRRGFFWCILSDGVLLRSAWLQDMEMNKLIDLKEFITWKITWRD